MEGRARRQEETRVGVRRTCFSRNAAVHLQTTIKLDENGMQVPEWDEIAKPLRRPLIQSQNAARKEEEKVMS